MTDSPTSQAMHLAMTELEHRRERIAELEDVLRTLLVMLPSDCPERDGQERIPASYVYIRWAHLRQARSVLNKETNRG